MTGRSLPIARQRRLVRSICRVLLLAAAVPAVSQTVQHAFFPAVTAVGSTASATVTVTPVAGGTPTEVRVLTEGIAGKDFAADAGGTCTTLPVAAGIPCTVNVTLAPTAPGLRRGAVVLMQGNAVLGEQLFDAVTSGSLAVIQPGRTERVAGNGSSTQYVSGEDGKLAINAHVFLPRGVVGTPAGDFYLADTFNNRIRHIAASSSSTTAVISTYAGTGDNALTGDGGPAASAALNQPSQLALDGAGNLYVADTGNNVIRRIDAATGIITTVAGGGNSSADDVSATSALLSGPYGVALDADGNLFIADTGNNVIRRVDAVTGKIRTVAGTGTAGYANDGGSATAAQLNQPWGIAFGPDGLLYIADEVNQAIRRRNTDGTLSTVVGVLNGNPGYNGDGIAATASMLNFPTSVALDAAGNVYIADSQNNRIRRAKVVNGSLSGAVMETIVASGVSSVTTTNGTILNSDTVSLSTPYAIALDGGNNLYVTDAFNKRVLLVHGNQSLLRFPDMKVGKTSAPIPVHLENDGTTALMTAGNLFNMSGLDTATTTCPLTGTLAVGDTCNLGVQFKPTSTTDSTGKTPVGTLTVNSDAGNAPDVITMTGNVLSVEPTTITLSAVPSGSIGVGTSVTFTVYVVQTTGSAVPSGTVTFYDGTTPMGAPVTLKSGLATYTTSALTLGTHTITAQYSGDDNDAAGTSNTVTETVLQATTTTLVTSQRTAPVAQTVTFTATVNGQSAVTGGTVSFYDGTTLLGSPVSVGPDSKASLGTSTLTGGTHSITAKFSGDTSNAASVSAALSQVITKAASTASVLAAPTTITVGNSVTLSATVTSTGPAPTGNVTFKSGSTTVGTGTLDSNGNASASTTALVPTAASITAVYAGDDYTSGSTSLATTVTVNKLLTTTTLSTSGSPSNAGSAVLLSATVVMSPGQTAVGAISGTVSFYDGANLLKTVTIANGAASLSTTALAVGTHSITATFDGSTNYAGSTSTALTEEIAITSSATTLSVSAGNIIAGNAETLTATVSANGTVKPTGSVTFTDGGANLGSAAVNATTGQAALTLTTLAAGTHNIVATYGGDADYSGSASSPATVVVRVGTVSLSLSATPAHTTYGAAVAAAITLTGDGILPANPVVTLLDNGTVIGQQTLNAKGTATYSTSTLAVGTHSLVAQFAGNANNAAAQSSAAVVTVDAVSTSTALSSSNLSPTFGDSVTLQAAVTSTATPIAGNVTFQDGATVLGVSPVSSAGIATLNIATLSVGRHTIVAVYGGDTTHSGSTSAASVEAVTLPTMAAVTASANPAIAGLSLTFTASVSGSAGSSGVAVRPTGSVTFLDGTTTIGSGVLDANGTASLTLSTLSAGTHSITAAYAGDTNFRSATSAAYAQTVRSAATQTALSSSLTPSQYSAAVTLTARVSGEGATPTGTVTFRDGATAIGSASLANGSAVVTVSTLSPGIHSLTASYSGDSADNASVSAAISQQVVQPVTIALVSSSNPALTLEAPVLTASLKSTTAPTPTGTVRFLEGTRLLGTGTIDANGNASITAAAFPAGIHAITAVYAGDTANAAVTSPVLSLEVDLRGTQTSLTATAPSTASGGILSLIAVVKGTGTPGPGGVVTFLLNNGSTLGTSTVDNSGVATLNVNSTAVTGGTVTASYGGNASYAASKSAGVTLPVYNATNFSLSLSPSPLSVPAKKYAVAYLTMSSVGGYSDTMQLGCLGLPYAATCTFDKDTVSLPANGSVTVKVVVDTGSPLTSGGSVSSAARPGGTTMLAALPVGALLLLLLRKRRAVPALFALMVLLSVTGCGTLNQSSTPAGSYTIQMSATGKATRVTLSLPVSLTVTR